MINLLKLAILTQTFFVFYPLHYGWEGADIRCGLFTTFILIIAFVYFARGSVKGHIAIPKVWNTPFFGYIALISAIGSTIGLLHGYPARAILSDLFPILEFTVSCFVGIMLIRNSDQAKRLVGFLIATISFVAWFEVIIYLIHPQFYLHQTVIKGWTYKRVVDFTPSIALILLLAIGAERFHRSWNFYALGVGIVISIFLTFLKSVWLASLIAVITTFILHLWRKSFLKRAVLLFGFVIIGSLIAKLIFLLVWQKQVPANPFNVLSLVSGLIGQLSDPELQSYERIQYVQFALAQFQESPIIGKGLGAGWWTDIGETRLAEQLPSQRWRTDIPIYPLFVLWKLGLLGLSAFFMIGVLVIRFLYYGLTASRDLYWRRFSAAMCGIYVYLLLISSFAFLPFYHFPIPFYMGIMSSIMFLLPRFQLVSEGQDNIMWGCKRIK